MKELDLQKFKFEERVKIASFKHRGDILAIVKELNLPDTYESYQLVKKALDKIAKSEQKDVAVLISNNLMRVLMEGHAQRVVYIQEMLRALEGREQASVSICCSMPVVSKEDKVYCMKCNKETEVQKVDKVGIFILKVRLLSELREEDKALVDFAVKMGYVVRAEQPEQQPLIKKVQNILYVGGSLEGLSEEEKATLKEISQLSPVDREVVIKKLEKLVAEDGRSNEEKSKDVS